ncbi:hypothetical protein ACNS7O_13385 [Haloferacaceae archaeon DSL9]
MPMKGTGATALREIDRWDGGAGWIAYPDETMERASHALVSDGDVWVVDPVDADGLDDLLTSLGTVAGVVVCFDRHERDAAAVARRHGASVHVATWMSDIADDLDAPIERFESELGDSGYRAFPIRRSRLPPWRELGLYSESERTLVVPESLGTAPYFRAADERLGVHPMLRLVPPTDVLSDFAPERILVGHGEGVSEDATTALHDALEHSRSRALSLYAKTATSFVSR